jgi:predicted DNA binding CopG/RHH family protein
VAGEDEYRIKVELQQPKLLLKALRQAQVEQSERAALGRVVATSEGEHIFLYADSSESASAIREAVQRVMKEHGIDGAVTLWRWHPTEERWEDASVPLPSTEQQIEAEHERRIEIEDRETGESSYAEFEVRVSLPSHHDAHELAQRLQAEGIPCKRYWRHLLIGAADEDAAAALAARVRGESPDGTQAQVEAVGQPIWEEMHPYSVFGGLGV